MLEEPPHVSAEQRAEVRAQRERQKMERQQKTLRKGKRARSKAPG
jgi:hypothetical protein